MADPKNEELNAQKSINEQLGEGNTLKERGVKVMQELFGQQVSYVESLKEAFGIQTKLTENESTQLKLVKEIARAINGQNVGLNSIKEKQKEIEKNQKLVQKGSIAQSLQDDKRVKRGLAVLKGQDLQIAKLADMQAEQLKSGKIDDTAVKTQKSIISEYEKQLDKILQGMSSQKKAALYQQASIENLKKANLEREAELVTLKKIEDSMGLTGALAQQLSKIPGLGGLASSAEEVRKAITEAAEAGGDIPTKAAAMRMIATQFKKDATESLKDPAAGLALGVSTVTGLFSTFTDVLKDLDKLQSGTARNFGISNKQAAELNHNLKEAGRATNDSFHSLKNMNEAFVTLNNRYGVFAEFSDQTKNDFVDLTKKAGITAEAAGALTDTTFLTGKGLKETTVEYSGQIKMLKQTTGLAINERQVLEAVKDVSAAIKLQLGGSAEAIATAVFKAKALGLEMKDLVAISSSLLNFQSSIEDELAAELLTGKQLNLEGARYAALIGDQAMLADELATNFGTAADFQKMNVIQQEAMAKAVGLNRDSLAESLMKREAMAALSAYEGENEKEKYENAVKTLGVDGARIKLGNEALADQMESTSLAEKFDAAMQGVKEAFLPLAEKAIPAIAGGLKFAGENMKTLIGLAVAYKVAALAIAAIQIMGAAVTSPGKALIGAGIAAAVIGGLTAMAIGDGEFKADGRTRITTKEGEFYPSIKDDIVVAPGAANAMNGINRNTGGNTQAINNNVTVSPSDTRITLNLNGQAIGNANARQAYGVGSNIKALGGGVDYSAAV
jgi:hypothetical protein